MKTWPNFRMIAMRALAGAGVILGVSGCYVDDVGPPGYGYGRSFDYSPPYETYGYGAPYGYPSYSRRYVPPPPFYRHGWGEGHDHDRRPDYSRHRRPDERRRPDFDRPAAEHRPSPPPQRFERPIPTPQPNFRRDHDGPPSQDDWQPQRRQPMGHNSR